MKIIYETQFDPGEGQDCEITSLEEIQINSVSELIKRLQKFMEDHPNAEIQGPCEFELGELNDDGSIITEMIFTTRK